MKCIEYLQAVIDSPKNPIEIFRESQKSQNPVMIVDVRKGPSAFLKGNIMTLGVSD